MYLILILFHILSATIWTGGHLILFFRIYLPAYKTGNPEAVITFEKAYEPLGMGSLAILILTGLLLVYINLPDLSLWLSGVAPASNTLIVKLCLLILTALTALNARLRIIPHLSAENLGTMGVHIAIVTFLSVAFVITGVMHRYGTLFSFF
ncbi:MAG: copper resistance protein CopD [Leptospiraceae bacterium]|nr:copper resistance protein CopD [Leptospiraceae bacterium]